MKLTVTLLDNGTPHEAIPVRALPFITGWIFSPDAIANAFSQANEARRMREVRSFRIRENSLTHVSPVDWEHVKVAMDGLDDKLPRSPGGYADWRGKSIKLLPAGVFVWLDEFSMAFNRDFSPSNWLPDSRGEYPVLNFDPMLPEGMTTIIGEGFPQYQLESEVSTSFSATEPVNAYPEMPYGPDRDSAIASRIDELRKSGVKAFQAQTAREFNVCPSAIKDAVKRHARKSKTKTSSPAQTSFAAQLSAANKRQKN